MPATQITSKEELCALSKRLKSRLDAVGRRRNAGLSTEFLQDLRGALDHLAELASETSKLKIITAQETCPLEPAQAEPVSADVLSISKVELSSLVAEAVASSLATWQSQFATSITQAVPTNAKDLDTQRQPDDLTTLLVQELETELADTQQQLHAAMDQLAECKSESKQYRELLERAEYRIAEAEIEPLHVSDSNDDLADQLKLQLEFTLNELNDLRQQNSELAAKLAQHVASSVTSHGSVGRGNDELLTWEERKLLILKQLEGDTKSSFESIPHRDRADIQGIIAATQQEIARRDEEIEELREIIRMQSDARAGVAIGAVGLAEILDSDELIQQERQKLREIQREWESKLRQAEIDLSMERAKIARERIAMEKQQEELARHQVNSLNSLNSLPKEKSIEHRWLRILGLNQ